jgi:hypothetical protein
MSDRLDRELEKKIRDLPRSMEPDRDLWTDIAARIGARRKRAMIVPVITAAFVLAAAATIVLVARRRPAAPAVAIDTRPLAAPSAAHPAEEHHGEADVYAVALRTLEASFAERRPFLPSDAVRHIDASLAVLDEAIGATKKALEEAPGSPDLEGQLRDEYEQKIRALTDIVDLARGAS